MLLSEGAGAAGLIEKSPSGGLFVSEIERLVYRELKGLDKVCGFEIKRNSKRRKRAHRENLLQLLGFYLCVSERFFISCGLSGSSQLFKAISDGVREAALRDSWRKPQHPLQQPIGDYLRAFSCQRHCQKLRERYPARPGQAGLPPDLLRTSSIAIALRVARNPDDGAYVQDLSNIVQARLQQTADELLSCRPYHLLQQRIRVAAAEIKLSNRR